MADYVPVIGAGRRTSKASATIVGRQVVAVSGVNTIAPASAGSTAVVGVAAFDAATNADVTIYFGGVQEVTASGSITAGSPVIAGAAGTVVAAATPAAGQQVGVAINSAADGALVRVQFVR